MKLNGYYAIVDVPVRPVTRAVTPSTSTSLQEIVRRAGASSRRRLHVQLLRGKTLRAADLPPYPGLAALARALACPCA